MLHIVAILYLKIMVHNYSVTGQNLLTIKKDARSTVYCFCRSIYSGVTKLLEYVTFYRIVLSLSVPKLLEFA